LKDVHDLKQDNLYYAHAVNVLANPEGFKHHYERLHKTFSDLFDQKEEIWKGAIDDIQKKIEDNTILTALHSRGFVLAPDQVEKLFNKEIPTQFFDINAKQLVDDRDPIRYGEFKSIIENYVEATKKEEPVEEPVKEADTKKEEPTKEQPTKPEQKTEETPKPEELHVDLQEKFDEVKTGQDLERLENELSGLIGHSTLKERKRLGITSEKVSKLIADKSKELESGLTYDNLHANTIVKMVNPEYGDMRVIKKTDKKLTLQKVGEGLTIEVPREELKEHVKLKYSDMEINPKTPTKDEEIKTKDNLKKEEEFIEDKEQLTKVMQEAYTDEPTFVKEFEETLGCP